MIGWVFVGHCWRCPGDEKDKDIVQLLPDPYDDELNMDFAICVECYKERSRRREWRESNAQG